MPVSVPSDCIEPQDPDAVCRFLTFKKFEDLISSHELYFNRADLFPQDETEGIPTAAYHTKIFGRHPLDVRDRVEMNNDDANTAQFREAFFISCWYLFDDEKPSIWKLYGEDGVAVFSRYSLLKKAIELHPKAFLAQVRYGDDHLTGWNTLRFIMTKREAFRDDREIRALLWYPEELTATNRHFDVNNFPHDRPLPHFPSTAPRCKRWPVDLHQLVTKILVSPYAPPDTIDKAKALAVGIGPVEPSYWTGSRFLP